MVSKQHEAEKTAIARDLFKTAVGLGDLRTLTSALQAAGLVRGLRSSGPYTLFAPDDRAFSRLTPGTLEALLKPASRERLSSILRYHVARGRLASRDLKQRRSLKTAIGDWAKLSADSKSLKIDGARVTRPDLRCSNGLIHVIDDVLFPNS